MLKKIDIVKILSLIMWGIAVFAYFFQFPFKSISGLIIPCLAVFLFLKIDKIKFCEKNLLLLIIFLIYITCSALVSWVDGTQITRIIRFAVILLAIVVCSYIRIDDFKKETSIFVDLAVLKSFIIIAIAMVVVMLGSYEVFRDWALKNNLGDIYYLNKYMPRVQVQGNALLVVAAIIEYMRNNKITLKLSLILLGIFFAGNFAYILGLGLFIVYLCFKKIVPILKCEQKIIKVFIALIFIAYIVLIPYLLGKIEEKAEVSNQTRIEQAEVLLDANVCLGEGLGNYIKATTPTREYDGDIYYELQTLYIINQIGLVGLLVFYMILFTNLSKRGSDVVIIYLIYLIYAFWNPYCFDTTQMIATLLMINMSGIGEKDEKGNCHSILSGWRKC